MPKKRIMVVEDDFIIKEYLKQLCEQCGCDVVGDAADAAEAFTVFQQQSPDVVLLDVRLGGKRDGVDVAKQIFETGSDARIVFITGSNEPPMIERINSDHPFRILIKPIKGDELREALDAA